MDIYKVKIGNQNPNEVNLEQTYQDNVPPEALDLDKFLKKHKNDKDSKGDFNVEKSKLKLKKFEDK